MVFKSKLATQSYAKQVKHVHVCMCEQARMGTSICVCVVGEIPPGVYCTHISKR